MKHIKKFVYPLRGISVDVILTIIYQILEAIRNFLASAQTDKQTTADDIYK